MQKQLQLLAPGNKAFGGSLLKKAKARKGPRPVSTTQTMHLVLRSSKAIKKWSFKRKINAEKIDVIVKKFSEKNGVRIISMANVGNHLHFHLKFFKRVAYLRFIRGITAAIAMAVTGACRDRPLKETYKDRFWDRRPFTRVLSSFKEFLNLNSYLELNQLEGIGMTKGQARLMLANLADKKYRWSG